MGNLSQVISYSEQSEVDYNSRAEIKALKKTLKQHNDYIKLVSGIKRTATYSDEVKLINATDVLSSLLKDDLSKQVNALFKDSLILPSFVETLEFKTLQSNSSSLFSKTALRKSPKATIKNITNIAEKLDMVIIPDIYFSNSYSGETHQTRRLIESTINSAEQHNLRPWFLTPISNYSVTKHMKSTTELEYYTSQKISMAVMAIKMIIPTLRGMQNQIDSLDRNDKLKSQQLQILETTVKEQSLQLARLSEQVDRQREVALQQQAELRNMQNQLSERSIFAAMDPLMILLPDSVTNIHDYSGEVILGPVWGPDIDNIVFELMDLKVLRNPADHNTMLGQ